MTTTKGEITERENIRNVAGKRRFIRQMDRQIWDREKSQKRDTRTPLRSSLPASTMSIRKRQPDYLVEPITLMCRRGELL